MDENKELLTPENEAEPAAETDTNDTDTAAPAVQAAEEEAASAEEETALAAAFNDDDDDEGDELCTPRAKSRVLQRTILISACVVVCAVLVAIVCRLFFYQGVVETGLFGNPKETCWHYSAEMQTMNEASPDEVQTAEYYFMFEPDGTLKIEIGTFDYYGQYTLRHLADEDVKGMTNAAELVGKPVLKIENTNSIDGIYFYEVDGNVFTGKKMTITGVSNEQFKMEFDNKAYDPAAVKREGEFKKDEAITGSWSNKNEIATQTLSFTDDGNYTITTKQTGAKQEERGIYSCEKGRITLTSYYAAPQSQDFKYKVDGDTLTIIQEIPLGDQTIEQPIEYKKD